MYLPKSQYIANKLSELKDKIPQELGIFETPSENTEKSTNYLRVLDNLNSIIFINIYPNS